MAQWQHFLYCGAVTGAKRALRAAVERANKVCLAEGVAEHHTLWLHRQLHIEQNAVRNGLLQSE